MNQNFNVILLDEARNYICGLDKKVAAKIQYNMYRASIGLDNRLFKKLDGTDIWEFRTTHGGNSYRMLAFWDKTTKSVVVATHGFAKKTQKTPKREIERAEKLMNEYYKGIQK